MPVSQKKEKDWLKNKSTVLVVEPNNLINTNTLIASVQPHICPTEKINYFHFDVLNLRLIRIWYFTMF